MKGGEENEEKAMGGSCIISSFTEWLYFRPFCSAPNSIFYGLHGTELECVRECSHGDDYRLIKLTVTDYNEYRGECRGHDAAKICTTNHAHGWQKDVVGMIGEEHRKRKVSVRFECETLKSDEAAEDHLRKFMPKLVGMDAVVNIGRMTIAELNFETEAEYERSEPSPIVAVCADT